MQMLVIVLSKAAFLKLGAIDPFQCSHKELQEEMEGEGQQGIYIYNFFPPPSHPLTPRPVRLAIV